MVSLVLLSHFGMLHRFSVKLCSIVGARPQFIKAAAVSRALKEGGPSAQGLQNVLIHTGQHYDEGMSEVFFRELDIPEPDYNLGVGSGPHGQQTARMLEGIEQVLVKEQPDVCLVYGDTNSTLAGALAAAKLHIPIAHVEAGLRSFNRQMPEEINRVLTDHLAEILFCPTRTAVDNLRKEGIQERVYLVGDVMYDCLVFYLEKARANATAVLCRFGIRPRGYCVATIHRAENTDDKVRLASILQGLGQLGADWPVVLPLHPRTAGFIQRYGLQVPQGIRLAGPISYLDMVNLQANARLILTDSGGIQKEAYWLKVPCVTLREQTEWVETVQAGWNRLAGADKERILAAAREAMAEVDRPEPLGYGDGHAAQKIIAILANWRKNTKTC